MKIRAGYEISYDCQQPTPMILELSVHPSRTPDLLSWDRMQFSPPLPARTYHDSFGNFCHVITAPNARQHALADLPPEALIYLLGSRYCETDRLSDAAWATFGHLPAGWSLVQAICDYVHNHITFGYQHADAKMSAWEVYNKRHGVCRDFAHLAITFCRCLN